MNLRELDELCSALEDKGLYREADVLHEQFMKVSQLNVPQQTEPRTFSEMLTEYAPTFLRLLAIAPTRVKGVNIPTFSAAENPDNVKLVQELLLVISNTTPKNYIRSY